MDKALGKAYQCKYIVEKCTNYLEDTSVFFALEMPSGLR